MRIDLVRRDPFACLRQDLAVRQRHRRGDRGEPELARSPLYRAGDRRFILSHHSYLVRTPRWTAIVDTCCGNHKPRPRVPAWDNLNRPYLDNMQALGVAPEEVDFVMCTHLHVDHVGWNTRLLDGRWVPTFPNARYLMGREEYRHFEAAHNAAPKRPVNHGSFEDFVLPVVAAGLAELVETDHRVFERSRRRLTLCASARPHRRQHAEKALLFSDDVAGARVWCFIWPNALVRQQRSCAAHAFCPSKVGFVQARRAAAGNSRKA